MFHILLPFFTWFIISRFINECSLHFILTFNAKFIILIYRLRVHDLNKKWENLFCFTVFLKTDFELHYMYTYLWMYSIKHERNFVYFSFFLLSNWGLAMLHTHSNYNTLLFFLSKIILPLLIG